MKFQFHLNILGVNYVRSARTQLVELDLSDNAFGPIGVKGLAALLSSSPCYTLQELRLNNNGLGITGGKILAKAVLDCHANSLRDTSKPFGLKVFIAGRNRIENEGATALSQVFEKLTTLEEVVMPQNGIYHVGIAALAKGLSRNQCLGILNLNDNTVGPKGAQALVDISQNYSCLERLNLEDCLLKTRGATVLADALGIRGNHPSLTELNLSFNEIKFRGVNSIADAMTDKNQLTSLALDGNAFGEEGRALLMNTLTDSDRVDSSGTLEKDKDDDEGESQDKGDEEKEESENESENDQEHEQVDKGNTSNVAEKVNKVINLQDFLKTPSGEHFLQLQGDKSQIFSEHMNALFNNEHQDETDNVMSHHESICTLCKWLHGCQPAEEVTDRLYAQVFANDIKQDRVSSLNNALLVNLGLLKGENKNMKMNWNLEGCFKTLEIVCQREYFLPPTRDTLKVFTEKPMKPSRTRMVDPFQETKSSLKVVLDRFQST